MKRGLYADVSARIVAELEQGAAPWIKPWSVTPGANTPCNAVSNRPYSGCNVVLLWLARTAGYRTPRFLTFKQASELGGNVRKGERGTKVFFVKQLQVRDQGADDSSETRLIPMMRETHWSGHKSRLDRDLKNRFGSRDYAAEELIAELGAAFLCAEFGFDGDVRNAGYIASWLLKADKRAFFTACS
jgi:antirestriction protein ArdC